MERSSHYYEKEIKKNQREFFRLVNKIPKTASNVHKQQLAWAAMHHANGRPTDVFSSDIIEKVFLDLAQQNSIPLAEEFDKGTVLHVMSEAYTYGGHTRCVERWISLWPEHRHSCIVMRQRHSIAFPETLREKVEASGGTMILNRFESSKSKLKIALCLRELAAHYEYIVLHVHPADPVPILAFGTSEFKRPVIYFNHATHIFWVGISIADHVADLGSCSHDITTKYREAKASSILGIPGDNNINSLNLDKTEARRAMNIPAHAKVVFSSGSHQKYAPIGSPSFKEVVSDILSAHPDAVFYIVGIEKEDHFWPELKKRFPERLVIYGKLDYATGYLQLLAASDLVIDSYPVGGGTAITDAVKAGKPVLTLHTFFQSDYLLNSKASCSTYEEFKEKAYRILHEPAYGDEIYQDVYEKWHADLSSEAWRARCQAIYDSLPACHQIHDFTSPPPPAQITRVTLITSRWATLLPARKFKEKRRKFFRIRIKKHEVIIRLFGHDLINTTKKK